MRSDRHIRRPKRREIALGVFGPIAVVASGVLVGGLSQNTRFAPAVPFIAGTDLETVGAAGKPPPPLSAAQPPAPDDVPRITRSVPSDFTTRARAGLDGFKAVCCKRANHAAYWTSAAWCDDVGSAVDERLCREPFATFNPDLIKPAAPPAALANEHDDLCRGAGAAALASCAPALAAVCCQSKAGAFETSRGHCRQIGLAEVPPSQCDQICCQRPNDPALRWDTRANCGQEIDGARAVVVSDDRCEPICCVSAKGQKRDTPRRCAAKGGVARSIVHCGTEVSVSMPDDESERLDLETALRVDVDSRRPPPASPFL